tara:strand:+ start:6193 stop:6630 length:438 start_codon:yes stop_codon:yes gene_type:complete
MAREAISKILTKAGKEKTVKNKIAVLAENDSVPLRTILRLIYDDTIEYLVPDTPPPFKKNELNDLDTLLYREARRLKIFFRGGGYDDLNQIKRESLFISLLEDLDADDAQLLANNLISHTPVKGLTRKTVEAAYPELFTTPMDMS